VRVWCVTSHGRLDRGVARISGHVARGRTDLEHAFVADLHGAGFRTSGFADVPDACARDRHYPRSAGFAVVRGDRRSALEGLAIRVGAGWALEDNVAAWHPAHVKPPILRPGDPEAQDFVVRVRPTRTCHPPGSVYVSRRTFWCCSDDGV